MKNVAVVSLLGDEIYQKHVGTTIFTNKDTYHFLPHWNLDEFLASFVEKELCRKQGFRCVDAKGGRLSLKNLYASAENYDRHGFKIEEIRKELEQAANDLGVDTFVLLVRSRGEDTFSGLPFHGYCISRKVFPRLAGIRQAGCSPSHAGCEGKNHECFRSEEHRDA